MNDNLKPEINPAAGVKRLNRKPLLFLFIAGGIVIFVMVFGIANKGRKSGGASDAPPSVNSNDDSLGALLGKIPNQIPADTGLAGKAVHLDPYEKEATQAAVAKDEEAAKEAAKAEAIKMQAVADAPMSIDTKAFQRVYAQMDEAEEIRLKKAQEDREKQQKQTDQEASTMRPETDEELAMVLPPLGEAAKAYKARREDGEAILPFKSQDPVSDLELKAGSIINATMITGINSDLPGQIIASVNQNVFDTRTGDYLLIPQGTRVFGTYKENNTLGVDRVGVIWNRLIFPDGQSVTLEDMSGADVEGYSGLKDKVNNHYMRIFGSALMLSGVGTGIAVAGDDGGETQGNSLTAQQAASNEVAVNLGRVITEKLRQDINIEPTITIRPGMKSAIIVAKDLTFSKEYTQHIDYSKLNHPSEPVRVYFDPTKGKRSVTVTTSSK